MEFIIGMIMLVILFLVSIVPIWILVMLYSIRRQQRETAGKFVTELIKLERVCKNLEAVMRQSNPPQETPEPTAKPPAVSPTPPPSAPPITTTASEEAAPPPIASDIPISSVMPPLPPLVPPSPQTPQPALKTPPSAITSPVANPAQRSEAKIPLPPKVSQPHNNYEENARQILKKIWNWIIVGADSRPPGVTMEYAIASNWLLRLGILILVVGFGFFLKYSIDHGLIGPGARVGLTIIAGTTMITWGTHIIGKRFHLFGQGLIGGGLATLYFSIFAAFNFYHLISQVSGFLLMVFITGAAGVLAVRLNSPLVAVLGIIGGYGTPVMLSTGAANFVGLFSYMLLLGMGILAIAQRKNWHVLNYLGLFFNYALMIAALQRHYQVKDCWVVMPYLAAFFMLYSVLVIYYNLLHRQKITLIETLGAVINAGVVFKISHGVIGGVYGYRWTAVIALIMAIYYTLPIYGFLRFKIHDRPLIFTFITLASFFTTITIPLAISRDWLTVSWAIQGYVFLWGSGKLPSRLVQHIAYAIYLLVLYRLLFLDFSRQFAFPISTDAFPSFHEYVMAALNRVIALGIPILAFLGAYRLNLKPPIPGSLSLPPENDIETGVKKSTAIHWLFWLTIGLLFIFLHFEINQSLGYLFPPMRLPSLTVLWIGLCLLCFSRYLISANPSLLVVTGFLFIAALIKLFCWDLPSWNVDLSQLLYRETFSPMSALMRLIDFGVIIAFTAFMAAKLRSDSDADNQPLSAFNIIGIVLLFFYLTLETNSFLQTFIPGFRSGGVTILWSIFGLALLILGIRSNQRGKRYAGLALFIIVCLKIFLFDLAHLDQFYRIIAFIGLGVLVLCASFLYLKYQHRFSSDSTTTPSHQDDQK